MRDKSVPKWIPTDSRRYGNHLRRRRGDSDHYYCDNCGNYAFAESRGFAIYPSKRIFCSKSCENEYYPKWLVALISIFVFAALGYTFFPAIKDMFW